MSNQGRCHASDREHLSDIDDGAGCVEIWEQLSERREARAKASGRNVRTEGNLQ